MTDEQLAALRAAAEKIKDVGSSLEAQFAAWNSLPIAAGTILDLLDHIAKLEAGRDAVIEECAEICEKIHAVSAVSFETGRGCAKAVRALKSAPDSAKEKP